MALATRELELVIMAKDKASATLARVSGALVLLGGAAVRAGFEGVEFFAEATNSAMEFRRQVALTFTQVEISGATFDEVMNSIKNTAYETAVPLEQIQGLAYDLFSTVTFDNLEQAEGWMKAITEAAVAGQAPIEDVGRSVIAWINAMDVAPTVENVNRVLDIQFELVRKGAGDFAEFSSVVGRAIPAFTAAGQGPEELGGALAFLTRNGLSAAMAATSAARAVELLYSPKAIEGLKKLGVDVEDSNGNFRKMDDLLGDVKKQFDGLSDAEKKIRFKEIFGTGSIQARRFFDTVLAEGNFEEFLFLLDEVRGSAGEVAKAFEIMSAEPAVALDQLKNRWEIIRIEIGERFLPLLQEHIIPALFKLTDWWRNLDDAMKDNIVKWGVIATAIVILGGAFAVVVGAIGLFLGLLYAFIGSWAAVAAVVAGGGLLFAGLVGGIIYAVTHWDELEARFRNFNIDDVKDKLGEVGKTIKGVFADPDITTSGDKWVGLLERIAVGWERISDAFGEGDTLVNKIKGALSALPEAIGPVFESLFENISRVVLDWVEGGGIERLIETITAARVRFIEAGGKILIAVVEGIAKALPMVAEALKTTLPIVMEQLLGALVQLIPILVQALVPLILSAVDTIIILLPTIIEQIVVALQTLVPVLLEGALQLFIAIVQALPLILPVLLQGILDLIMTVIELLPTMGETLTIAAVELFMALLKALEIMLPQIITWILTVLIPGLINTIGESTGKFFEVGVKVLIGLASGIASAIGTVLGSVRAVITGIISLFTGLPGQLWNIGKSIITGLGNGISSAAGWVRDKVTGIANKIGGWFRGVFGISSPSKLFAGYGVDIIQGLEKGWSREMKSFQRLMNTSLGALERQQMRFTIDPVAGLSGLAYAGAGGARTTIGTSIGSQIVIERVESQADASDIARAIAWEAMNS